MKNATAAQSKAINSEDPTILCLAGPGSGKTTVLVHRIRRLLADGAEPRKLIALTFTNAAARELEERLGRFAHANGDESMPPQPLRLGYVGTLHGFALKMLKEHGGGIGYGARMSIISPESAADLLASKAQQIGCKTKLADLMKWKQKGRPATHLSDAAGPAIRLRLCKEDLTVLAYYDELLEAGIVDFDVLLEEFARMITSTDCFPDDRFTHLFVDEVQDSGRLDWQIYKGLDIPNKFLVGDPDQAIYSFRGGEVDQMLKFAKEPGVTLIPLEENFRSHVEITTAAQKLIEHNRDRFPKATISVKGDGGAIYSYPEHYNEGEEVGRIVRLIQNQALAGAKMGEIAILVRNNFLLRPFSEALIAAGIPVIEKVRSDLPKDWAFTRSLIEFLVQTENDTLGFFLMIERALKLGIPKNVATVGAHEIRKKAAKAGHSINRELFHFRPGMPTTDVARELAEAGVSLESRMIISEKLKDLPEGASMMDLALSLGTTREREEKPLVDAGVTVSTIHGAKGREWDCVFIAGLEDEITPGTRKDTNVEEERRLLYVAVTRARKVLHLSFASSRLATWGKLVDHVPSRFIKELLG